MHGFDVSDWLKLVRATVDPCPFCGSRNAHPVCSLMGNRWRVVCGGCGAQGPERKGPRNGEMAAGAGKAVNDWNFISARYRHG